MTPTLTLTHNLPGWDGTFGHMLDAMAGVLDDGPVEATVIFWDREARQHTRFPGDWLARSPFDQTITFKTVYGETLTIDEGDIKELSLA